VKKVLVALGAGLVLLGLTGAAAVLVRWRRTFDAPYPSIAVSRHPAAVERGRYIVYGPGSCAYCHVPKSEWPRLDRGETPPLTGNHLFPLPFGDFYSANLTPDQETGIGRRSDGELARTLRYGVLASGHAMIPFMEYQGMSDEDLGAVIAFLRAQPPVRSPVPPHALTFLGKALFAFAITPRGPTGTPALTSPSGATVERGAYLANDLAMCVSCHTDRDLRSGTFKGPRFAGGQRMDFAADPDRVFVPPNLTPDPGTGRIARWTEQAFLERFRLGTLIKDSIMPWGAFARMTDDDLRAIYRYLNTLPAIANDTGPVLQKKR
jgi:mono/diheme cytochrome c family protein